MSSVRMQERNPGQIVAMVLKYGVCVLVSVLVLVPLGMAVLGGFKRNADLVTSPFGWPETIVTSNYTDVITSTSFWQQLWNSTFVMLVTSFGVVLLASMAAFVFARIRFPGRELLFNFFTLGLLFP